MGYMTVEDQSSTLLHLKRSPGIRSWSLLVGKFVFCANVVPILKYDMRSHTSVMDYSLELLQNHKPLIFTAGIASVGLTAAYYSSGMQAKIYMICHLNFLHLSTAFFSFLVLRRSRRQHPVEALLRGRLSVCGHAEHGGMGGGCVW